MAERAVQFCEEDILIFNQCIKQDANKIFRINGKTHQKYFGLILLFMRKIILNQMYHSNFS